MRTDTAIVRRAEVNDLETCAAIINAYIDATPWLPRLRSRAEIASMFNHELLARRTVWVAEINRQVVGYLSLDESRRVQALYLTPAARGHGLGKRLLDVAKRACPEGFDLNVFGPNEAAYRFYVREGLEEVSGSRTTENDEKVEQFVMRWKGNS